MERFQDGFTDDFQKNKEALSKITTISSKQLRNEIAGYITSLVKQETSEPAPEESASDSPSEVPGTEPPQKAVEAE